VHDILVTKPSTKTDELTEVQMGR